MKKFLSILLATLMIVSLVPSLLVSAAAAHVGKATAITEEKNGRTYHFYESFDTDTVVQGASKVMNVLGWELPDNTDMAKAHEANVKATEKGQNATYMYELKNGRLYLRNHGTADEYMLIADSGALAAAFDGAYVMEYTLTYLASSTSTNDGYMSLIYKANSSLSQYAESVLRISGWGDNRATVGRGAKAPLDAGDVSVLLAKETGLTAYRVDNDRNPTLYEKLCGNVDNMPGTANDTDIRGSKLMVDVEMRVRMEFDGTYGPRIYVNDILVSDPRSITDPARAAAAHTVYEDMLMTKGSCLAICVTPGIDCVLDEITVYETRTAIESSLYITEVAPLPDNKLAPYIEIYNGGNAAMNLADYAFGYVTMNGVTGKESIVGVGMTDYIGKTLTVGDVALDNLSADAAILAPGEVAVIFPVAVNEDVADLIATVEGVTMAGFRAEYGLSADAKVLAIANESFTVEPTEHRFWFIGDYLGERGRPIVWSAESLVTMKNSARVQCMIELVPSVAFGYESDITDTSLNENGALNFGREGDVQAGYAAHYAYGMDTAFGKVGTMISRTAKTIAQDANVGALLEIQADYFERIAAFRAGHYVNDGALAITEIIPVTDDNDAYEAFEITNISKVAINLYDYALVSSGDAVYGSVSNWTNGSVFEATVNGIYNPGAGTYSVQPGASVIVWNMTDAADDKTVADFRAYYGLSKSAVVFAVDSTAANSVVAANAGTVSYGVAPAGQVRAMLAGNGTVTAVSDVTVPVHSLHYSVDGLYKYTWNELVTAGNMDVVAAMTAAGMDGCEMLGVNLPAGASLDGYFTREIVNGMPYYVLCPTGSTVAVDDTTEYFAPKDTETFFAYGSKQDLSIPAGAAITVSYGATCYADKTSGSMMSTLQVSKYVYDTAGRGYGPVPYLVDVANRFVTVDCVSALSASTLGSVQDKQGVDIAVKFSGYYTVTYLDGNGEQSAIVTMNKNACGDVYAILTDAYDTWQVNGVKYDAGALVAITDDTVIAPGFLVLTSAEDLYADNGAEAPAVEENALSVDVSTPDVSAEQGNAAPIIALVVAGSVLILAVGFIVLKKRRA